MDPFCEICWGNDKKIRTKTHDDAGKTPCWNYTSDMQIIKSDETKEIQFIAHDEDLGGECEVIGELTIIFNDVISGKYNEESWLKFNKNKGEIFFSISVEE